VEAHEELIVSKLSSREKSLHFTTFIEQTEMLSLLMQTKGINVFRSPGS